MDSFDSTCSEPASIESIQLSIPLNGFWAITALHPRATLGSNLSIPLNGFPCAIAGDRESTCFFLSIPLNGFMVTTEDLALTGYGVITFNSIEWIRVLVVRMQIGVRRSLSLSIPLNGF